MQILKLRTIVVPLSLMLYLILAIDGTGDPLKHDDGPNPQSPESHASGLTARVTLPDGTNRPVTVDGFGCSRAICSRVFVEATSNEGAVERIWIDRLSAIQDITANSAVFVMKDGTQQRLQLITDFRVLYSQETNATPQKLDLSKIRSLQMVESGK